jgi:hypothetical protein
VGSERYIAGQRRAWYARFSQILNQHAQRENKAGMFAQRLAREGEAP